MELVIGPRHLAERGKSRTITMYEVTSRQSRSMARKYEKLIIVCRRGVLVKTPRGEANIFCFEFLEDLLFPFRRTQ